jgi:tetratricopeptide (TPR) repeat protein
MRSQRTAKAPRRRIPGTTADFTRVAAVIWGIAFAFAMQLSLAMQLFGQVRVPTELPLQIIVVRSQEEALQIFDRLKKGADFSEIAKEQSIDPTAADRGFLGAMRSNQLRPELRDALNGLGPGQLSPVVSLPSGYAILRVMRDGEKPGVKGADPSRDLALAASGAIKFVQDIDGLAEAETALARFPKAKGWNWDPGTICGLRKESLASVTAGLKDRLAADAGSSEPAKAQIDAMEIHFSLGQLYAYRGDMQLAIKQYLASYDIARTRVPEAVLQLEETLGVAYLHQSEMENGAYRNPGGKDLFPISPESAYENTADSRKAIEYFLKYLEKKPEELELVWLLNIAYMTLGRWPADVPSKYVIPPSAFQS